MLVCNIKTFEDAFDPKVGKNRPMLATML